MSKKKNEMYDNDNAVTYGPVTIHESRPGKKEESALFEHLFNHFFYPNVDMIEAIVRWPSNFINDFIINKNDMMSSPIKDSIVSILNGIPTKEDIVIDIGEKTSAPYQTYCGECDNLINNLCLTNVSANNMTIVVPIRKDDVSDKLWKYGDMVSHISSTSILYAIIINKKIATPSIMNRWLGLNEKDRSEYTNVMFVPNIPVFYETKTNKKNHKFVLLPFEKTYKVNLLFVAVPSRTNAKSGIEKMEKDEYCQRVINDCIEAAVKCGCKRLIIDPFKPKNVFKFDSRALAKMWKSVLGTHRAIENIDDVSFVFDDENNKIIFDKA
jgi:hypothetical protein